MPKELIEYSNAILTPETELEKLEGDSKIKLKPQNNIIFLARFDDEIGSHQTISKIPQLTGVICGEADYNGIVPDSRFGNALSISDQHSFCAFPFFDALANQNVLKIGFWIKSPLWTTNGLVRVIVGRYYPGPHSFSWAVVQVNSDLAFITMDSQENFWQIYAYNLNLQSDTWYYVVATTSPGIGKIFVGAEGDENCVEVASGEMGEDIIEPGKLHLDVLSDIGEYLSPLKIDELSIQTEYQENDFPVPDSPLLPFSQNLPKVRLSLDSSFQNAIWDMSTIGFFDEKDFENEGIKLRVDSDNNNTPLFSGELLTLAQTRALKRRIGRYLHLEFSFISDGDIQRTLYPGWIEHKAKPNLVVRRAPEIIPRI